MSSGAAQAFFVAGTIPPLVFGALHGAYAVYDTARAKFFAPRDRSVKTAMEETSIRLMQVEEGRSMWRVWLGVNIAFGLSFFTFGLLCLLIAAEDFDLVERIEPLRPLTIAFSAACLVISLRFFFWQQALIAGTATACFIVAAALSA